MKKIKFLLLALMLCLSLCACGGIAGEEAAALYPDIIGEWGTDPFGEEYVLTLAKDGSCVILGNSGTWQLDSKQSNEEFVILTLKTEQLDYYVKFDRVQKDRKHMFNSVNLLVMDAKQEVTIYENYVYTQSDEFISSELALHTVPEVVGIWGSYYWTEEPVFTVREDGTCSVLRQPGKWCLWRDFSTWPKLVLLIKLDNGLQYECEFNVQKDQSYNIARFSFYNRSENKPLYIDSASSTPIIKAVNRSSIDSPFEIAHHILGSWVDKEDGSSIATFNDDGTCTLRGAEGIWTIDYNYTFYCDSSWQDDPTLLLLLVTINDHEYCVHMWNTGHGSLGMIISDNGIEIATYSDIVNSAN